VDNDEMSCISRCEILAISLIIAFTVDLPLSLPTKEI